MDEKVLRLKECSERVLDMVDREGRIDHITHEGMVEDLREALWELEMNDC